jgi:L-galactose dehydrogenase
MTNPCGTTVVGSASPAHVKRDVEWIGEPIDADLLADVAAILEPVRDIGWINGRAEHQDPGRAS